jgi:alkaline phosphatase D
MRIKADRQRLAKMAARHKNEGLVAKYDNTKATAIICGDRHWQFHSIHPKTGLNEFSCDPASDKHVGGWSQKDFREDYHQFLRVKEGYLSVAVDRTENKPSCTFRFDDVDGKVHYKKDLSSTSL